MLKTIIVEDEYHSREALKNLLQEFCDGLDVIAEASSVEEAIFAIGASKPDLVFMDIELGDGTAFDILKSLGKSDFQLIFTTAFDQYAIRAIRFNALDYLLKPVDIDELTEAVEKARARANQSENLNLEYLIANLTAEKRENPVITLSTSDSFEYVRVNEITRCEAQGAYTKFYFKTKPALLVSKTLKEYEGLLGDHGFLRVHQSHLISLREVDKFIKSDGGYVLLRDGTKLGVSRGKREDFLSAMQALKT